MAAILKGRSKPKCSKLATSKGPSEWRISKEYKWPSRLRPRQDGRHSRGSVCHDGHARTHEQDGTRLRQTRLMSSVADPCWGRCEQQVSSNPNPQIQDYLRASIPTTNPERASVSASSPERASVPASSQRGQLIPNLAQRGPLIPNLAQRGLLFPNQAQRGLPFPRLAQRGLLFPHLAQGGPQIPSQAQRGPLSPESSPKRATAPESSPERASVSTFNPERAFVLVSGPGRASDPESRPERASAPTSSPGSPLGTPWMSCTGQGGCLWTRCLPCCSCSGRW